MNFIKDYLLGGISGAIGVTLVYPLERIKLGLTMPMDPDKPYTGIVDYVVRSTKKEGVTSLWRGNRAIIIKHSLI